MPSQTLAMKTAREHMVRRQNNTRAISQAEFARIDELQRNLHLIDASRLLDFYVDKAIDLNDEFFLRLFYQFHLYAMLPGFTESLLETLVNSIENAHREAFLITALNLYANFQNALGNSNDVTKTTERLLELSPKSFDVLYLHVLNGGTTDNITTYKKLWRNRDNNSLYIPLGFSLYELYEKQGHKKTEKALLEANAFAHKRLQNTPPPKFSPIFVEASITTNTKKSFNPVFIMGLPRSGTTLLEQQLSGFAGTRPLGECNFLKIGASYANVPVFFQSKYDIDQTQCDMMRHAYFSQIASRGYNEHTVLDKSLSNLSQLPLMEKIFPDFSAIISFRDPVKNALSIFRKKFEGDYRYAYNIEQLCDHVRKTSKLIKHYQKQFQGRDNIHFINLDEHVADPSNADTLVRNVLGTHVAIKANADHNKSDNVILTASARQARKPMSPKQMHDGRLLSGVINSIENCLKKSAV